MFLSHLHETRAGEEVRPGGRQRTGATNTTITTTVERKHDDPTGLENQELAIPRRQPKVVSFRMAGLRKDCIKLLQPAVGGSGQATAQREKTTSDDDDRATPLFSSEPATVARLSEQPRRLTGMSPTSKGFDGRLSSAQVSEDLSDSGLAVRCSSTMQRKCASAESSSSEARLIGTLFMAQTESPISSISSVGSSRARVTPEEQFQSWLRQSQKTRSSNVFAKGGKDRRAMVSKSLIEVAKARQEREAIEESQSDSTSSLSNSGGEGAVTQAQATQRLSGSSTPSPPSTTMRPTRSSMLPPPRTHVVVSPRLTIRTQEVATEMTFESSTPRLRDKAPDGKFRGHEPQAGVDHGKKRRESMGHYHAGTGGDVHEPAPSMQELSTDVVKSRAGNATTARAITLEAKENVEGDDEKLESVRVLTESNSALPQSHPVATTGASSEGHDARSGSVASSPPTTCANDDPTKSRTMALEQGADKRVTSNLASPLRLTSSATPFDGLILLDNVDEAAPFKQATAPKYGDKATQKSLFGGDADANGPKQEPREGELDARLTEDDDGTPARTAEGRVANSGLDAKEMKQIGLFDTPQKRFGVATKALETSIPRLSSESKPEGINEYSHGSGGRQHEGTEGRPGTTQCQLNSQKGVATGGNAEKEGGQDGPQTAQKTSRMLSAESRSWKTPEECSGPDGETPEECSGPDGESSGSAQVWSLHTGRDVEREKSQLVSAPTGLSAWPVAVHLQGQEDPGVAKGSTISFSKTLCSTHALQPPTATAPVSHDVLASPTMLASPVRGKKACAGGNEGDFIIVKDDKIRPNTFRGGSCECSENKRVSSAFRHDAPTTERKKPFTDPWPTGVMDEDLSTLANRGLSGRLATNVSTEMKRSNNGGVHGIVDESGRISGRELASSDLWRAASTVARRSVVTRDRWCARILAEAAATIAHGRGMRESIALSPDQAKCDCGRGGAYDGVQTRGESISPRSQIKQPMKTGVESTQRSFCAEMQPEKSQLMANAGSMEKAAASSYSHPMGNAHVQDADGGCRAESQVEQTPSPSRISPPTPTVGHRNVRDSWSTRILGEVAATLAHHGLGTSPVKAPFETISGTSPRFAIGGNRRALKRKESFSGGQGSVSGGCRQCLKSQTAESPGGKDRSSFDGRADCLSRPTAQSRIRNPVATVLGRWTFSGSGPSSQTPLVVDFGSLWLGSPTENRPSNRLSTTGAYPTSDERHVPDFHVDTNSAASSHGSPRSVQQGVKTNGEGEYWMGPIRPSATRHSHGSISVNLSSGNVAGKVCAVEGGASPGKNVFSRVRSQTREFYETFLAREGRMGCGRVVPDGGSVVNSRERPALPIVFNEGEKVSIAAALRRWSVSECNRLPSQLPTIVDSGSIGLDL